MPLAKGILRPSPEEKTRKHEKKCLVQSPNSYFMDLKCPGYCKITTVFSRAQMVMLCVGCSLSSVSPQEEKQGLQKDASSEGSSAKSTTN